MGVNDCFKVPACERNCCFRCSDDAEKGQNDVGVMRLMNEAMKKAANCGFLLFLILLGGVDGENQHYTQASAHIFNCEKSKHFLCFAPVLKNDIKIILDKPKRRDIIKPNECSIFD